MKFNEMDSERLATLVDGNSLPQNHTKTLSPSNEQENKSIENQTHKLTVGNFLSEAESISSSRRSSIARWKAATDAIIATNVLEKRRTETKNETALIHRKMNGTNAYIPVFPLWLSIILLILNCIVPGLGTILSSFVFCCVGTIYNENDRSKLQDKVIGIAMTNLFTGVAQLFTTSFLLVGWFWSISRGVTMVYLAIEAKDARKRKQFDTPAIKYS